MLAQQLLLPLNFQLRHIDTNPSIGSLHSTINYYRLYAYVLHLVQTLQLVNSFTFLFTKVCNEVLLYLLEYWTLLRGGVNQY